MRNTIALPLGKSISVENARTIIEQYLMENTEAVDLYDRTNSGPHDELLPIDLLSLGALNAFGGASPMSVMASAWSRRVEISQKIQPITRDDFSSLSMEKLRSEQQSVCNALDWFWQNTVTHWGGGGTRPAKLLYRLRPNIIPIWDEVIGRWYGGPKQSWKEYIEAVHADLLHGETLWCLRALDAELKCSLPFLRLWDILLWKRPPEAYTST